MIKNIDGNVVPIPASIYENMISMAADHHRFDLCYTIFDHARVGDPEVVHHPSIVHKMIRVAVVTKNIPYGIDLYEAFKISSGEMDWDFCMTALGRAKHSIVFMYANVYMYVHVCMYVLYVYFMYESINPDYVMLTEDLAHAVRYCPDEQLGDRAVLDKKVDALVARVLRSVLVSLHPHTDPLNNHTHHHHHRSSSSSVSDSSKTNRDSHSDSNSKSSTRSSVNGNLTPAPTKLIYQLLADLTLSGDTDKVLNHLFFSQEWSRQVKVDAASLKVRNMYVCMYACDSLLMAHETHVYMYI